MKEAIFKTTSYISKNYKILILIILLFISVLYNIKLKIELDKF